MTRDTQLDAEIQRRGIPEASWSTLCNSLFPGANPYSVLMVWDYCTARNLDPLKKPCHIVPMKVKDSQGQYNWRDVIMPGIYEYRITAHRTGKYLGHSEWQHGPILQFGTEPHVLEAPEWFAATFYRLGPNNLRIEFPVKRWFAELVTTKPVTVNGQTMQVANDRWQRAPIQMGEKSTEAAGLREALPEELGGQQTVEELEGRTLDSVDATVSVSASPIVAGTRKSASVTASMVPDYPTNAMVAALPEAQPVERIAPPAEKEKVLTRAAAGVPDIATAPAAAQAAHAAHLASEAKPAGPVTTVSQVQLDQNGVAWIVTSDGIKAATSSEALIKEAQRLQTNRTAVTMVTRPARNPALPLQVVSIEAADQTVLQ